MARATLSRAPRAGAPPRGARRATNRCRSPSCPDGSRRASSIDATVAASSRSTARRGVRQNSINGSSTRPHARARATSPARSATRPRAPCRRAAGTAPSSAPTSPGGTVSPRPRASISADSESPPSPPRAGRPTGSRAPGCGTRTRSRRGRGGCSPRCRPRAGSSAGRRRRTQSSLKNDVLPGQPQLVGERACSRAIRISGTPGFGCRIPMNRGARRAAPASRSTRVDQRQRVEPVVDAAAPEEDLVVGADARRPRPEAARAVAPAVGRGHRTARRRSATATSGRRRRWRG